jgi:hypothetical protein
MRTGSIGFLMVLVFAACAGQASPGASSAAGSAGSSGDGAGRGGTGDSSLADAANALTDACAVMPTDLAATIVPGGAAPVSRQYPLACTVTNQVQVLETTISTFSSIDTVNGAEQIPGIATDAFLERLIEDQVYLSVVLGRDPGAMLYVEVVGNDGKDHKQDAIDVANAVIARLH